MGLRASLGWPRGRRLIAVGALGFGLLVEDLVDEPMAARGGEDDQLVAEAEDGVGHAPRSRDIVERQQLHISNWVPAGGPQVPRMPGPLNITSKQRGIRVVNAD